MQPATAALARSHLAGEAARRARQFARLRGSRVQHRHGDPLQMLQRKPRLLLTRQICARSNAPQPVDESERERERGGFGFQQQVDSGATPAEAARGWARPPCRPFKNQSWCCLGSAFEVAAFKPQKPFGYNRWADCFAYTGGGGTHAKSPLPRVRRARPGTARGQLERTKAACG
jgi:hypothetical protein